MIKDMLLSLGNQDAKELIDICDKTRFIDN
jgi:hypothetical protein